VLNSFSRNSSGFDDSLNPVSLTLLGTVVPEPSTGGLLGIKNPRNSRDPWLFPTFGPMLSVQQR